MLTNSSLVCTSTQAMKQLTLPALAYTCKQHGTRVKACTYKTVAVMHISHAHQQRRRCDHAPLNITTASICCKHTVYTTVCNHTEFLRFLHTCSRVRQQEDQSYEQRSLLHHGDSPLPLLPNRRHVAAALLAAAAAAAAVAAAAALLQLPQQ
jgi:hypothetical protein